MIVLTGTLEGGKELSRKFVKAPELIGNLKPTLFKIDREVRISVDANFGARGSLFGEPWPKRKDSKPHPLLEKTGRMRRSFESTLGSNYVEIYNVADYFKYHQSAAPRHSSLPRRVMLKIDEIRKVFIVKAFQAHVREQLRK